MSLPLQCWDYKRTPSHQASGESAMLVWLSLYPQLATTPQLCPRVNILTTGTNCQLKKSSKSLITELLHTYQHIHDITQKDPSHMSFQTGSPRAVAHRNDRLSTAFCQAGQPRSRDSIHANHQDIESKAHITILVPSAHTKALPQNIPTSSSLSTRHTHWVTQPHRLP